MKKGLLMIMKYSQNTSLCEYLKETGEKFLIEASPHDSFWGSGLSLRHDEYLDIHDLPGDNKLGSILMELRDQVLTEQSPKSPARKRSRLKSPSPLLNTSSQSNTTDYF